METPLQTTYRGHHILIEPYEWGYLAHIVELGSGKRFIAANTSALRALEDAFDVVDESVSLAGRADEAVAAQASSSSSGVRLWYNRTRSISRKSP
jgi:hypothetical protein